MNTLQHLSKVLPYHGLKVVAVMRPLFDDNNDVLRKEDGSIKYGTFHKVFHSVEDLTDYIRLNSNSRYPLYMAMGGFDQDKSFIEKTNRKGEKYKGFSRSADFTSHFRAIWLDIDVGESKAKNGEGYATQTLALEALQQFVEDIGLPQPMLVNSGGGVHAYWAFTQDVEAADWLRMARAFDGIIKHYKLLADPSCTVDRARILRPIGTTNHKYGKKVSLISDAPAIPAMDFIQAMKPYYLAHKEEIKDLRVKISKAVDRDGFQFEHKPRKAKYFLSRCQVGNYAVLGEDPVAEPVWRGVISVLRHCDNGEKHIETLRNKCKTRFPETTRFDADRTAEKLNWLIDRSMGPFTCDTFKKECPQLCEGCPFALGSIKTPLSLAEHYDEVDVPQLNLDISGLYAVANQTEATPPNEEVTPPEAEAPKEVAQKAETKVETPQPPYPYKRTAHGLVVQEGEKETVFFRGDCFPLMTRFIEYIDGERNIMVKFMLRVGMVGNYQEVSFPMKDWYAADKLKQKLGSVGVSITEKYMQHFLGYMRKYLEHVGDDMKEIKQLQHFGWVGDQPNFLLGDMLYSPEGVMTVQPHINLKNYTRYFKQAGSLVKWKELMQRLADLGAVEQQICMLSSFGSTLMKFTNYNGIWFHLMTKPGYGKTTTQEMMNGIWGNPHELLLNAKDTLNAIEERFGRWSSIGVAIDEVSNLDPRIASELLLGVTQGRTKQRLGSDMRERVNDLTWQMMVVSSGNFSLIDRINTVKEDVAAEISRTLEFKLPKPTLSVHDGELLIKKPIRENYGVAGAEWLSNLVQIPSYQLQTLVDKAIDGFSSHLNSKSDERFWIAGCAVVYVAGQLTNKMGLTNWDMDLIFKRLCEIVLLNRQSRTTYEFSAADVLASFLSENTRNTVVTDKGITEGSYMVKLQPSGALNVRYEQDAGTIFVRTQALKEYCAKRNIGVNSVKANLEQQGLLVDSQVRIVMSKGLPNSTGRSYCVAVRVDALTKATLDTMLENANE